MRRDLVSSLLAIVVITVLFGLGYPLAVTGISQVAFHGRANGSLIERDGKLVGSRLLAQDFRGIPRYFQPRPSTATSYEPAATAFTNLGPNSRAARRTFAASLRGYLRREKRYDPGLRVAQVPVDAVTSSGSGVDPQISPANAAIQAHRVAAVRHLPLQRVTQLIAADTDGRSLGVLGEPGVNVLELNLAIDHLASR
ncbi:MAG: potassium-transporting ATPase KdpC subunit [Solirubrobacteraceae bacterium]|nr:potassium-transporting ATPase KdpC subunit [Solirubrobacteraceae bacterium]